MKKTLNKKMLESIIKRVIAESLSKDSDELDRSNPSDNDRINQEMDSDWNDLEAINKKYANSVVKDNPRFAKHFNHNVEDGREEAETFSSGLYESIRRMVSETLNEIGDTPKGRYNMGKAMRRAEIAAGSRSAKDIDGYKEITHPNEFSNRKGYKGWTRDGARWKNMGDLMFDKQKNFSDEENSDYLKGYKDADNDYARKFNKHNR